MSKDDKFQLKGLIELSNVSKKKDGGIMSIPNASLLCCTNVKRLWSVNCVMKQTLQMRQKYVLCVCFFGR